MKTKFIRHVQYLFFIFFETNFRRTLPPFSSLHHELCKIKTIVYPLHFSN